MPSEITQFHKLAQANNDTNTIYINQVNMREGAKNHCIFVSIGIL